MKLKTERHGATLVVMIDRPNVRNAIDGPTATALAATFRAFDADDALAIAILTGAGGNFCAGADLKSIASGADSPNASAADGASADQDGTDRPVENAAPTVDGPSPIGTLPDAAPVDPQPRGQ